MTERPNNFTPLPRNAGVDAAVTAARRVINALLHAGNNSAADSHMPSHGPSHRSRFVELAPVQWKKPFTCVWPSLPSGSATN